MPAEDSQIILVGAYGWKHPQWNSYYPEELPEDWRLAYYSNEFNAVMVPAAEWLNADPETIEGWADDVPDQFRFFIELPLSYCQQQAHDVQLTAALEAGLEALNDALAGIYLTPEIAAGTLAPECKQLLAHLARTATLFSDREISGIDVLPVWRQQAAGTGKLALLQDDLSDLRQTAKHLRTFLNSGFAAGGERQPAAVIVQNEVAAADLYKLRQLVDMMT
jgi:hypothetical protein